MPKLIEYFSFRQGFSGPPVQGGRRGRGQGRRGVWRGDPRPVLLLQSRPEFVCLEDYHGEEMRNVNLNVTTTQSQLLFPWPSQKISATAASRFMNSMASGESRQPADGRTLRRGEKRTHPKYMFTV